VVEVAASTHRLGRQIAPIVNYPDPDVYARMRRMKTYPICLIGFETRRAVIVGGGAVATRKVNALLEADARVTVISPQVLPDLQALADGGKIELISRSYVVGDLTSGDLATPFLVIAATDSPEVNRTVWQEASALGCLINVVDDPAHSNFIAPAVVRRGELNIAITTGGGSPALARRLREQLTDEYGPEYGELAALLAELRPELLTRFSQGKARLAAALALVDSDLLEVIRQDGMDAALERGRVLLDEYST
jgi:precorrin-2 dehydrogenase / sirohydrochlorin ferrochelatase